MVKEFILLSLTFLLLVYIFANKDNPYIPLARREQPYQSKRQIINWFGFKGPMFVEGFADFLPPQMSPDPYYNDCNQLGFDKCKVNPLTSEISWRNQYYNYPYRMKGPTCNDLGNFAQTTNNNLDSPNHLKCVMNGRWGLETCRDEDRISPACYQQKYNVCGRRLTQ